MKTTASRRPSSVWPKAAHLFSVAECFRSPRISKGELKNLLTLPVLNVVCDPVLIGVPFIPLEASNILEFVLHKIKLYTITIYKSSLLNSCIGRCHHKVNGGKTNIPRHNSFMKMRTDDFLGNRLSHGFYLRTNPAGDILDTSKTSYYVKLEELSRGFKQEGI